MGASQETAPRPGRGAGEETILVCEDDDDVRAYTNELLSELGYRVLEARDGASTLLLLLARLRSHPWRSLMVAGAVTVASAIAVSALAVLAVADDPWAPLVEAMKALPARGAKMVMEKGAAEDS